MEKLEKLSLEDLMEMLREEMVGDAMPYYWSMPLYAPAFSFAVYQDNMDKMAEYMVKKHGGFNGKITG